MIKKYFLFLTLLSVFSFTLVTANSDDSIRERLELCLNESDSSITELKLEGFNIIRLNDSLKQARELYNAQILLKSQNRLNYDFSSALVKCNEVLELRDLAIYSSESLGVLIRFYNDTISKDIDTTEIDATIEEIKEAISSERYEEVDFLVSKAYEQISSAISAYSRINAFYKSASGGILRFIYLNKFLIISFLIILFLFFIIYHKKMKIYFLKKRITSLELRKSTIKSLIMHAQKEFFEKGSISEGSYNIRVKKFGEMILDIDRQIPLMKEELIRTTKDKKSKKKVKKKK